jgi:FO synthase
MEALIRSAGRVPRQRTTLYGNAPPDQVARSFRAAPLALPSNPHVNEARLERPRRLVRPALA